MSEFRPLQGIRVIEASHIVMGPACGMFLACLGAEVVKVEPPGGEPTRHLEGMGGAFFVSFNRGKKSVELDLESQAGRAVLDRLLSCADVLVENFSGATARKMGLGGPGLRARHPHLVLAACKGFLRGPYEERTAADEVIQMMTGLAYMTGPSGRPLRSGASILDILGGLFGALGVVSALREREATGSGREIRIGLFETGLLAVAQHMISHALLGTEAPPMPERAFSWPVYDIFETADGRQVFVGAITDRHWRNLCEALDLKDLLLDSDLATRAGRIQARDRTLPVIRRSIQAQCGAELTDRLAIQGVPCALVARPAEMYRDPHARRQLRVSRIPDGRQISGPGMPFEIDGVPIDVAMDVPAPGGDTEALLRTLLGLSMEEIRAARGVRAGLGEAPPP